jgi:hypothetical protein
VSGAPTPIGAVGPPVRPDRVRSDYFSLDTSLATAYVPIELLPAPTRFTDPSAHGRQRDVSHHTGRDLEREANVFGAELLMPEAAVREAWAASPAAAPVAERFEVSVPGPQWRLYSFGLAERPA